MTGYQENIDVSTVATGSFKAELSDDGTKLAYELSYSGLEGNVLFAHVHFGKAGINGGVSYFLCGGGTKPDPVARTASARSQGEISSADVIGPVGQGIEAGNFAEILAAMRAGHAYANVHSSKWPRRRDPRTDQRQQAEQRQLGGATARRGDRTRGARSRRA